MPPSPASGLHCFGGRVPADMLADEPPGSGDLLGPRLERSPGPPG
jgi:hypothetical protein